MERPIAVRLGSWLLLVGLLSSLATFLWPKPEMSGIGAAATSLLIYGTLLYAITQRRNWARLVFAFLYVVGVLLSAGMAWHYRASGATWSPVRLGEIVLIGAGLVCLFLPSASGWYHVSHRSSLTSA